MKGELSFFSVLKTSLLILLWIGFGAFVNAQGPKINRAIPKITIRDIYRFNYTLPDDTFIDAEDGSTPKLNLLFYQEDGRPVPKDNWVLLQAQSLLGYITKDVYNEQGSNGYKYYVAALDKDGHETKMLVEMVVQSLAPSAYYYRHISLTSRDNGLVFQYGNVEILFAFHNRMAAYLQVDPNSMVTQNLTVNKGSNQVNISLEWSVSTVTGSVCMPEEIVKLRKRLEGENTQKVRQLLLPAFTVIESNEFFTGSCSYLSADPPRLGVQLQFMQVSLGVYFVYNLPSAIFLPPVGSTMDIQLELQFSDGTKVGQNYWLKLEKTQSGGGTLYRLLGFVSFSGASAYPSGQFRLAAYTPILVSSFQEFRLSFTGMVQEISFKVTLDHVGNFVTTYSTFFTSVSSFISTFLSIDSSILLLLDWSQTSARSVLTFTLRNVTEAPCNIQLLNELASKMFDSQGSVQTALRNGMQQQTAFTPSSGTVSYSGSCSPPRILSPIGTLTIAYGDKLAYTIELGAYRDNQDGTDLSLSLLNGSGDLVPSYSWVNLDQIKRTIVAVPIDQDLSSRTVFNFTLRVTNKRHASVYDHFSIKIVGQKPPWSVRFGTELYHPLSNSPLVLVLFSFINKLSTYLLGSSSTNLYIHKVTWYNESFMFVAWQNTSFLYSPCDFKSRMALQRALQKTPAISSPPKSSFDTFMRPDFVVSKVSYEEADPCTKSQPKPPYPTAEMFKLLGTINVLPWEVSVVDIGVDLFKDEEDINLENMRLALLSVQDSSPIPGSFWIALQHSPRRIVAVPTDIAYRESLANTVVKLALRVYDTTNMQAELQIGRRLLQSPANPFYNITIALKVSGIGAEPYSVQLLYLKQKLNAVMQDLTAIYIRSYTVSNVVGTEANSVLVWSPMTTSAKCNFTLIQQIRAILFLPGSKRFREELNANFGGNFKITGIQDSSGGPCSFTPPFINILIPTLSVRFCGVFQYQIPKNAYTDLEDGDTRTLFLSLRQMTGEMLSLDSWIQFNESRESQTVYGLLTSREAGALFSRKHTFVLVARDASGLTTNQTLTVEILGTSPSFSYIFEVEARVSKEVKGAFYLLAQKFAGFLGDTNNNVFGYSYQTAVDGKRLFGMGNCSMRYEPCDVNAIVSIRSALKEEDGSWKSSFLSALAPEFQDSFFTEKLTGPCSSDKKPRVVQQVGLLKVSPCSTFTYTIPANSFYDDEQGNARSLKLSLTTLDGTSINKDFWVDFNVDLQVFTIMASRALVESLSDAKLSLRLVASDYLKQTAEQTIVIEIARDSTPLTHVVTMQARLSRSLVEASYITRWKTLRDSINSLTMDSSGNSVEFIEIPSTVDPSIPSTIKWGNCSLPKSICDDQGVMFLQNLVTQNGDINPDFRIALFPNFNVLSARFEVLGACKDKILPPEVQNPIPTLEISFCRHLEYKIPDNVFYDKIDGNTRQLSLKLTDRDGKPLEKTDIAYFDEQDQKLYVVLYDNFSPSSHNGKHISYITYKLIATSRRLLSVETDINLKLNDSAVNVTLSLYSSVFWKATPPYALARIMSIFAHKLDAYFPIDGVHFTKISTVQNVDNFYLVTYSSCSLTYSTCNLKVIQQIENMTSNALGPAPDFVAAMLPEFDITTATTNRRYACRVRDSHPFLVKPIQELHVSRCQRFSYPKFRDYFHDEEDGNNLYLTITKINGLGVSPTYKPWISIIQTRGEIIGVVTDDVVRNYPSTGYNVTVRATDSKGQLVETSFMVYITGTPSKPLYSIIMNMENNLVSKFQLQDQHDLVAILNSQIFKQNITNVLSFDVQNSQTQFRWSVCTLSEKCQENEFTTVLKRLVSDNKPTVEISQALVPRYTLSSITYERDPSCQGPLNPPKARVSSISLALSSCGGFEYIIPEDMFIDPEDGNLSNLEIGLTHYGAKDLQSATWIQLNTTTRKIYGLPTQIEANYAVTTLRYVILTAKDKSGLDASIQVNLTLKQSFAAKYMYSLKYEALIPFASSVDERIAFALMISSFLETTVSSFGLLSSDSHSQSGMLLTFANCSVSYNPCDLAALNAVKERLLQSNTLPTTTLAEAASPRFKISYGYTNVETECSGNVPHPPYVTNPLPTLHVTLGEEAVMTVSDNTFYDLEDGQTHNMQLTLYQSSQAAARESWVHYFAATKSIVAFGTASSILSQPPGGYSFRLIATDSSGLSTWTPLIIRISGKAQVLQDCKIESSLKLVNAANFGTTVDFVRTMKQTLARYFSLPPSSIAFGAYSWTSASDIVLSWGLLPLQIKTLPPSSQELGAYHQELITGILQRLFADDRKTVQQGFSLAFGNVLSVLYTRTAFSGYCGNLPPLVSPTYSTLTLQVPYYGYRVLAISNTWFYDYEQGGTTALVMNITTQSKVVLSNNYWVSILFSTNQLVVIMTETQRRSAQAEFHFYFIVTDFGGQTALMELIIQRIGPVPPSQYVYQITYEVSYTTATMTTWASRILYFMQRIASFYDIDVNWVIIISVVTGRGVPMYHVVTWTAFQQQTCSSSVLTKTVSSFSVSDGLSPRLLSAFQSQVTVERVYYSTQCNQPSNPPTTTYVLTQQNISFCSFYTFQLPFSAFTDRLNGDARRLQLQLLDNTGAPVTKFSWLQLNTAKLQLYGFAVASAGLLSQQFALAATNSGGLKNTLRFQAKIIDYPFTSDCMVTMLIEKNFGSETMAHVDVLWYLLTAIKEYYGDAGFMVKVHAFANIQNSQYKVTYSNCSFQFSTKYEALRGLSESHRSAIESIYNKIVTTDGTINTRFLSFMLPRFTVREVNTSYSCIEKPPSSGEITEVTTYAYTCQEFTDYISNSLFIDEKDGFTKNLHLSLHYTDGQEISRDEWLQLSGPDYYVYGALTDNLKRRHPSGILRYVLKATDSSGRVTNVSYIVRLADPRPAHLIKFTIGFSTTFQVTTPKAYLLRNITRKIARYLDPTDFMTRIYVYDYLAPSQVTFAYCNMVCTDQDVRSVARKLQETIFQSTPNINVIDTLKPEFNLYYVYVDGPQCIDTINVTVINPEVVNINISQCGVLEHRIPVQTFMTESGAETRHLHLSLNDQSGNSLGLDSWIHMDSTLQTIYAVPTLSKLSQTMSYQIAAKHSQSAATSTTRYTIRFSGFLNKDLLTQGCYFSVIVTHIYTRYYPVATILKSFMEKLANFLKSSVSSIQIFNYARLSETYLQISWSNCSWKTEKTEINSEMKQSMMSLLNRLIQMQSDGTYSATASFVNALQPSFVVRNVTHSKGCNSTEPDTPQVNVKPDVVQAGCGELKYLIPENTFKEGQKTTRQLNLEMLQVSGSKLPVSSWVYLDVEKQTIFGLPNKLVVEAQPDGGYRYILKATSKSTSESVSTEIRINVTGTFGKPAAYISIIGQFKLILTYDVQNILFFTRKLASSQFASDSQNRLYIYDPQQFNPIIFALNVANCSTCDLTANLIMQNIGNSQQKVQALMSPEIDIKNSLLIVDEEVCDETEVREVGGDPLQAKFCERYSLDITTLLQNPIPDGFVAEVRERTNKPLYEDSWLYFVNSTNMVYGFPTKAVYQTQGPIGYTFIYLVKNIKTNKLLGIRYYKYITILPPVPENGLQFSLTFTTKISPSYSNAYFILQIWDDLISAVRKSDIQTVSFTRDATDTEMKFTYTFQICSLPKDCNSQVAKETIDLIFTNGLLREDFRVNFRREMRLEEAKINCNVEMENKTKNENVTLNVSACSVAKHSMKDLVKSNPMKEKIVRYFILQSDYSPLPLTSWIWLNATAQEMIALPSSAILNSYANRFSFQISVLTQSGKTLSMPFTIFPKPGNEIHFKLTSSFTSKLPTSTPYLVIQLRFLNMVSNFLGLAEAWDYQVIDFDLVSGTSNMFYFRWGLCSVTDIICRQRDEELNQQYSKLVANSNKPSQLLQSYASKSFDIISFSIEKHYKINSLPRTVIQSRKFELSRCEFLKINDISNMFYDTELDANQTLRLQLTHLNGSDVAKNSWVYLLNGTLFIIPNQGIVSSTYSYRILAYDSCKQKTEGNLIVTLMDTVLPVAYKTVLAGTVGVHHSAPDSYLLFHLLHGTCMTLGLKACSQRVLEYSRTKTEFRITFDYCRSKGEICNQTFISMVRTQLSVDGTTIHKDFQDHVGVNIVIKSASEVIQSNCSASNRSIHAKIKIMSFNVSYCFHPTAIYHASTDDFFSSIGTNVGQLSFSLLSQNMGPLPDTSWLQLEESTGNLYVLPRAIPGVVPQQYKYILLARDMERNTATMSFVLQVVDKPPLQTYKFKINGKKNDVGLTGWEIEQAVLRAIIGIFGGDTKWTVFDFAVQSNGEGFDVTVGVCQDNNRCNCSFQFYLDDKLRNLDHLNKLIDRKIIIQSVTVLTEGPCASQNVPTNTGDWNEIDVVVGHPTSFAISEQKFLDIEDGNLKNLTLHLLNSVGRKHNSLDWINIPNGELALCSVLYWDQKLSVTSTNKYEMRFTVQDKCGAMATDFFIVHFVYKVSRLLYFLTLHIADLPLADIYNCQKQHLMITLLSNYTQVKYDSIFLVNYASAPNETNSTVTVGFEIDCNNLTEGNFSKKFIDSDGGVSDTFFSALRPNFSLLKAFDNGTFSCQNTTSPIIRPTKPPPIGVTWWVLIVLLIVFLIILLIFITWLVCPRCCTKSRRKVKGHSSCFQECCFPGGRFASAKPPKPTQPSPFKKRRPTLILPDPPPTYVPDSPKDSTGETNNGFISDGDSICEKDFPSETDSDDKTRIFIPASPPDCVVPPLYSSIRKKPSIDSRITETDIYENDIIIHGDETRRSSRDVDNLRTRQSGVVDTIESNSHHSEVVEFSNITTTVNETINTINETTFSESDRVTSEINNSSAFTNESILNLTNGNFILPSLPAPNVPPELGLLDKSSEDLPNETPNPSRVGLPIPIGSPLLISSIPRRESPRDNRESFDGYLSEDESVYRSRSARDLRRDTRSRTSRYLQSGYRSRIPRSGNLTTESKEFLARSLTGKRREGRRRRRRSDTLLNGRRRSLSATSPLYYPSDENLPSSTDRERYFDIPATSRSSDGRSISLPRTRDFADVQSEPEYYFATEDNRRKAATSRRNEGLTRSSVSAITAARNSRRRFESTRTIRLRDQGGYRSRSTYGDSYA